MGLGMAAQSFPSEYDWRYMTISSLLYQELTEQRRAVLRDRLNQIERSAIARHMPGSHAEQVYVLREHIQFVRENLSRSEIKPSPAPSE
jgi:hypothetical protein